MTVEEALIFLDKFLDQGLNNVQELVFRSSWEGQTYPEMAESSDYDANYIKDVGSKLWKLLSQAFAEEVTKSNFRSVLRRRAQSNPVVVKVPVAQAHQQDISPNLEIPSGSVPLNSSFYIERYPIESQTYAEICKPGSLIRIKAPGQMGKTSLMHRILTHAKQTCSVHTVLISLQRADHQVFTSLDKFLRWFCANVSRQLKLEPRLDEYWDEDIGSKVSCTLYFQGYLLEKIDAPIVLALDEVNRIFEYPEISHDFLPLLRSWYEDARELEIWQKLRLIVVHATEAYIPLDINQSPFNVGLSIKLPEFTLEQVQNLALLHGLEWARGEVGAGKLAALTAMIGGHPYLVRIALYHLAREEVTLEQLLQDAPTIAGIYSSYLRHHLANVQSHPELAAAFLKVITQTNVQLEAIAAYKLESMGLIKLEGNQAIPTCELYRLYFHKQLG
ncbi:AAA-like domain-containing protein [Iningainema tapete]|uniref:AAA-like domain-containing protein n=1 Tax=Iningainema tapete BLCC-T55 TaxID=2748662 RepID=A0A8J6XMS2_9CYAN|nr:AAA-like domain-containing protein [Iningainema tapete]MBD2777863.1 AAA-like domain-containing protein [Iningainema tapete BLCC-T55]